MGQLRIQLLGSFEASIDARPITKFESAKVRALLAYLAVEYQESHTREKLVGLFWPELPDKRARKNLSQALYNLRRLTSSQEFPSPIITATQQTVQFCPSAGSWVDVHQFQTTIGDSKGHAHRRPETCSWCAKQFKAASQLYRGDFLAGFSLPYNQAFEEWVLLERERLQRLASTIFRTLSDHHAAHMDYPKAIEYARRQIELDPWRESAHQHLMQYLALDGQCNAALAQYQACSKALDEALKVEPQPKTTALFQQIRDGEIIPTPFQTPQNNLPAPLTSFVGRDAQLTRLRQCLNDPACRLITLVGVGGSGKTRLALEAAREELSSYQQGVFLVSLAALQNADSLLPATAEALGYSFRESEDPHQQLVDYLRPKSILLILDNFEHLLDGVDWVLDLLRAAPQLCVLATSRIRLNVKGEHIFAVSGLDFPTGEAVTDLDLNWVADQYSALQLFADSAKRTHPEFTLNPENAPAVIQICQIVQGMPLALLLASAWIGTYPPDEIAVKIQENYDILTTEWRDLPVRQRSMRAVLDQSWDLLTTEEQKTMMGLSVFRGGFTHQAAKDVVGASLHTLQGLVNKLFLQVLPTGRFELHELVRQYGREKLAVSVGPEGRYCSKHSTYFLGQLDHFGQQLKSPQQIDTLSIMDIEHENIHTAWYWAINQKADRISEHHVEAICLYYDLRMRYPEGIRVCQTSAQRLSEISPTPSLLLTNALLKIWESSFTRLTGKHVKARILLENSKALLDEARDSRNDLRRVQAHFYREGGNRAIDRDNDTAYKAYTKSDTMFKTLNERWWSAKIRSMLVFNCNQKGEYAKARKYFEENLAYLRQHGDPDNLAGMLSHKSYYHVRIGELDEALEGMVEVQKIYVSMGDPSKIAAGQSSLGTIYGWRGEYQKGIDLLSQSLAAHQELGSYSSITYVHTVLGMLEMHNGNYMTAEEHYQSGHSLAQKHALKRLLAGSLMGLGWLAMVKNNLPKAVESLSESVSQYRAVNHQEELSWALAALGHTMFEIGEADSGWSNLRDAIEIGKQVGTPKSLSDCLTYLAFQKSKQGNTEEGLELYSLACQHPAIENSRWFEDMVGHYINDAATDLPADLITTAKGRGRGRDLWETATELLAEMDELGCLEPTNKITQQIQR